MSTLSITLDTDDKAVVSAIAHMFATLEDPAVANYVLPDMDDAPSIPDTPTLKVVPPPPPADVTVEPKTYDVEGYQYTAETILDMDITVERMRELGYDDDQLIEIGFVLHTSEPEPNVPTVDIDASDMPWDPRIHAGTKTHTVDGNWKKKRGVDPALVETVETELRALMAIEPTVSAEPVSDAPPPPGYTTDVPPPPGDTTDVPPPPRDTTDVPPPAADAEADAMTFAEFLKACSAKMTAGETDMARILEVVNAKGIASLQLVANRLDLIPEFWASISTHQKVAQ